MGDFRLTTAREIFTDLCALGVAEGMNLVVHSSLSSLGHVEGGPGAVIEALLEALGCNGTLVTPTFTFPPPPVFDSHSTRSTTGLIAETFRMGDGVLRSLHPTHSVAACGPLARHFVDGHPKATALGIDSPLHRLALSEGLVMLLGVQQTSNAMVHVGEAVASAHYLDLPYSGDFNVSVPVRMPDGNELMVPPRENPGCSINFNAVQAPLDQSGAIRHGRIAEAESQLIRATDIVETVGKMLETDSDALLCDIDWCPFCPRARELTQK